MARPLAAFLRSSRRAVVPRSPITFSVRSYSVGPTANEKSDITAPKPVPSTKKQFRLGEPLLRDIPELETPVPAGVELNKTALAIDYGTRKVPYLYFNLRDGCQCPVCVDPHSKQRNFRTTDIPVDITPRKISWNNRKLKIQWAKDIEGYDGSHTTVLERARLVSPNPGIPISATPKRNRKLWNKYEMDKFQHWVSYEDFMKDGPEFSTAMRSLASLGLIFVKDIPSSREEVEKLATRMGPLRNTFYGPTWDVKSVPQATNVAYTNQFLGFHMDLMYMNEPPGYQLLHCIENSCDGGESLFADAVNIAEDMQLFETDYFKTLTQFQLGYEYMHEGNKYSNHWPVFETGATRDGKAQVRHVNYSPPFQSSLLGYRRSYRDLEKGRRALVHFANRLEEEETMFELKLKPGECVIFENRRVVHARRQFNTNSGNRWLAGAYVDEDALMSKFRVCSAKYPEHWQQTLRKARGMESPNDEPTGNDKEEVGN